MSSSASTFPPLSGYLTIDLNQFYVTEEKQCTPQVLNALQDMPQQVQPHVRTLMDIRTAAKQHTATPSQVQAADKTIDALEQIGNANQFRKRDGYREGMLLFLARGGDKPITPQRIDKGKVDPAVLASVQDVWQQKVPGKAVPTEIVDAIDYSQKNLPSEAFLTHVLMHQLTSEKVAEIVARCRSLRSDATADAIFGDWLAIGINYLRAGKASTHAVATCLAKLLRIAADHGTLEGLVRHTCTLSTALMADDEALFYLNSALKFTAEKINCAVASPSWLVPFFTTASAVYRQICTRFLPKECYNLSGMSALLEKMAAWVRSPEGSVYRSDVQAEIGDLMLILGGHIAKSVNEIENSWGYPSLYDLKYLVCAHAAWSITEPTDPGAALPWETIKRHALWVQENMKMNEEEQGYAATLLAVCEQWEKAQASRAVAQLQS